MPLPAGVTTRTYSGTIVGLDGANATGTLEFRQPHPIYDATNNVVVGPRKPLTATVTNGAFSIALPVSDWPYTVRIDTDRLKDVYPLAVPPGSTTPLRFADTYLTGAPPALVEFYALLRHVHGTTDVPGLDASLTTLDGRLDSLEAAGPYLPRAGGTLTGPVTWSGTPSSAGHLATKGYVDSVAGGEPAPALPLYNVEDYGALGDGATDDYPAIRAAWDAMLASPVGGLLYFPRAAVYRIAATLARLGPTTDKAYALFPLPLLSAEAAAKRTFGVLGVGEAATVRTASSFGVEGNPAQIATATILKVDYTTSFTWSTSNGLPSVFGAPDADITGHPTDNTISNLHFHASGLIVRQPDNPSLCGMNLELVSTASLDNLRFDVASVLDDIPEPTRPTGAALLAPKSNNNVAVELGALVFEGHYTGVPFTEHVNCRSAIMLRCKIAVSNRRPCTHMGDLNRLKIEQCTFGFAGYDPAGAGPNLGVVPWYGGTVNNVSCNFEHFAYFGQTPWSYTPTQGCDFYAPNGGLAGRVYVFRVNSEPPSPDGIGVAPFGGSTSVYVRGPGNGGLDFTEFAIFTPNGAAAQRLLGTTPANTAPNTPTIGAASPGQQSAVFAFTPAVTGPTASSYTATARRSSDNTVVGTQTGSSSPITVPGLTAGVPVYGTVHATNYIGDSAESAASNTVTPNSGVTEYRLLAGQSSLPTDSATDGSPICLGIEFKVTSAAQITALHFYRSNTDITGTITGRIFEVTGVGTGTPVAGTDVTFTLTATGWHTADLAAPVTLSTSVRYAAVLRFPDRWPVTANFWSSGPGSSGLTNGPLTAHNTATSVNGQGIFGPGDLNTYPSSGSSGSNYWIDVTVAA